MKKASGNLAWKTIAGFVALFVIIGLLIFVPAGSLGFWEGWVTLCNFALCAALITVYLWKNDPGLLERRVEAGPGAEKEKAQNAIQIFSSLCFAATMVVPALDHRFGWSNVPLLIIILGDVLIPLGFFFILLVFRENTFTAATIQVAEEQKVISSGPYALVRHPMYISALIMLFGLELSLGSWWGLLTLIPFTFAIILRLLDEEKYLSKNLRGYDEYCGKVRFRLIPFIW
jgi:protein-S-isoprenylcysteine O-methyltransferase Ste14